MTSHSAHQKLTQRLTRLHTLIAANRALTGVGLALIFILSAGIILVILESIFYLRPILKIVLESLCALCFLYLIARFCIMPFIRPPSLDLIALRVEQHFGGLQQHLINALQLWRQRDREEHATALVDAAIIQAERTTQHLPYETLINRKPPIRAATAVVVLALLGLLLHAGWPTALSGAAQRLANPQTPYTRPPDTYVILQPGNVEIVGGDPLVITAQLSGIIPRTARLYIREKEAQTWASFVLPIKQMGASHHFPNITRTFDYRLSAHDAQTPTYTATVHPRPIVTRISHHDRFPPHTAMPDRINQQGGDIIVPIGTEVSLTIEANKPLESAALVFDDATELPAAVSSSLAQTTLTVKKDVRYSVHLRDPQMITNKDPVAYRIVALPDQPPDVRLLHPGQDIDLTESMRVSLVVEAFDDYGISRLQLRYQKDDDTDHILPIITTPGREIETSYHWDMSNLDLLPGDQITYKIRAYDNNPRPSFGETATFTIRMPSLFEIHREADKIQRESIDEIEAVQQRGRELDARLKELARDMLSKDKLDWQEKRELEKARQTQEQLAEKIESTAEQLDRALDRLQESGLLEDDTLQKLEELQSLLSQIRTPELEDVMQKLDEAIKSADPNMVRDALEQFQMEREKFRESIDRALALLRRVQQQQTLDALNQKLEELAHAQDQITQNIEREPAEELTRRQTRIARDTEQLRTELQQTSQEMDSPTDNELDQIANAIKNKQLTPRMDQVRQDLDLGQRQNARSGSDSLARDLQNMSQSLAQARQRFIQRQKDEIARELNRVLHDLLTLSQAEERTAQRANEAESRDETAPLALDQARAITGASRMAQRLMDASQKTFFMPPSAQAALGQALNKMEGAAEQLNAGNASQAAQLAREAMGEINRAAMMVQNALGQLASSESGTGFEEMMEKMSQLAQQQGSLNAQTENLFGQPGQSGQPSWQKLAAQQRAIRDALNALRGELARQQREMLGDMGKIASDMRETARELLQRQVAPQTLMRQRQILSRLLDAQQAMKSRGKSKKRQARTGENLTYRGPGSLPADLGEADNPLRHLMRDALKEG
ncbi:MAG: hypothetical protein J4F29_19060, partial [Candidatus Latescibacteria bacterium]|nr:hypothetical protein [Candidatus Latescibacterota bacterium]